MWGAPQASRTVGGGAITAVRTLIGDMSGRHERAELGYKKKQKNPILLEGGFHSNPSHHIAP